MSITPITNLPIVDIISSRLPLSMLAFADQSALMKLSFASLLIDISAQVTSIERSITTNQITIKTNFDNLINLNLILEGYLTPDNIYFQTKSVSLSLENEAEHAQSDFLGNSILAMIALEQEVTIEIPIINLNLKLHFNLAPKQISELLKRRQIAYRLMIIEKATNKKFHLPKEYSAKDIKDITYVYKAIAEKQFSWPANDVTILMPATKEQLDKLPSTPIIDTIKFDPKLTSIKILDQSICLGEEILTLKDATLKNFNDVKQELMTNDGHNVKAIFISTIGEALIEFLQPPTLTDASWSPLIKELINLEDSLDNLLIDQYNLLAKAGLANLSEDAKEAIAPRKEERKLA